MFAVDDKALVKLTVATRWSKEGDPLIVFPSLVEKDTVISSGRRRKGNAEVDSNSKIFIFNWVALSSPLKGSVTDCVL